MNSELYLAGADIVDEPVKCSLPVTILGNPYFAGFLAESTDAILGEPTSDYGLFTAVLGGGTQYTVRFAGEPAANECLIDLETNMVAVPVVDTLLYASYPGYGRLYHPSWDHVIRLTHQGVLDASGGDVSLYEELLPFGGMFRGALMLLDNGPSGGTCPLRIQKLSGTGTEDLTFADGTTTTGYSAFANRLKFHPRETLKVIARSTNPMNGLPTNLTVVLYPG